MTGQDVRPCCKAGRLLSRGVQLIHTKSLVGADRPAQLVWTFQTLFETCWAYTYIHIWIDIMVTHAISRSLIHSRPIPSLVELHDATLCLLNVDSS